MEAQVQDKTQGQLVQKINMEHIGGTVKHNFSHLDFKRFHNHFCMVEYNIFYIGYII